jgi:hypothetical protein
VKYWIAITILRNIFLINTDNSSHFL